MTRVRVVDDSDAMREGMMLTLNRLGYEVRGVKNGAEALAAYARRHAEVVITDLRMVPMDGLEVVRRLRSSWAPFEGQQLAAALGFSQAAFPGWEALGAPGAPARTDRARHLAAEWSWRGPVLATLGWGFTQNGSSAPGGGHAGARLAWRAGLVVNGPGAGCRLVLLLRLRLRAGDDAGDVGIDAGVALGAGVLLPLALLAAGVLLALLLGALRFLLALQVPWVESHRDLQR